MGGRDHNENADFTDLKASQAVNDGRIANVKLRERLRCQRLHLPERHFFVSFVFEKQSAAAATVISHYALEDHGCAPQQYRSLRSIRATDLVDFARQAQALFWIVEPQTTTHQEDQLPLAVAATR